MYSFENLCMQIVADERRFIFIRVRLRLSASYFTVNGIFIARASICSSGTISPYAIIK